MVTEEGLEELVQLMEVEQFLEIFPLVIELLEQLVGVVELGAEDQLDQLRCYLKLRQLGRTWLRLEQL